MLKTKTFKREKLIHKQVNIISKVFSNNNTTSFIYDIIGKGNQFHLHIYLCTIKVVVYVA